MPLYCECGRPGCPGDLTCLEKASPPLDAERVSDAKLPLDLAAIDALLTALDGTSLFDCFDDVRKNIDLLVPRVREVLAELQRLRATQRESGGVSVPRDIVDMAATLFAEAGPNHIYGNGRILSRDEASRISRMLFALSASQRKECE